MIEAKPGHCGGARAWRLGVGFSPRRGGLDRGRSVHSSVVYDKSCRFAHNTVPSYSVSYTISCCP